MVALSLRWCSRLSLVVASGGYSSLQCTASYSGVFSCCRAQASGTQASIVVAHSLYNSGSVAVVHGLSCSVACEIFQDRGSNQCPLHLAGEFLSFAPPS